MGTVVEETYSDFTEEDQTPQLDYKSNHKSYRAVAHIAQQQNHWDESKRKSGLWCWLSGDNAAAWCTDPFWCNSVRLTNGEATCYSPRGGRYRSTLGTRCEMKCDRGYRLLGRSSIRCLPTRRWSGTAFCRSTWKLRHTWGDPAAEHHDVLLVLFQRCVAVCCTSFHTEGTRARVALKWTPGATSPAALDIALRGNSRAPVCPGGRGAERSPCAQVSRRNRRASVRPQPCLLVWLAAECLTFLLQNLNECWQKWETPAVFVGQLQPGRSSNVSPPAQQPHSFYCPFINSHARETRPLLPPRQSSGPGLLFNRFPFS